MRTGAVRLGIGLAAAAILCGALAALAAARPIFVQTGDLEISFNAVVRPKALPRSKRVPIAVNLSSRVLNRGAGPVPPITQATIDIDKAVAIDGRAVPACSPGQLENQTTEAARAACRPALVGSGSATLEIAMPGAAPFHVKSTLLAFNGGASGGTSSVLLHAYLTTPTAEAIVVPVTFSKRNRGLFGLRARVTVPTIAAGAGSLTAFDLEFAKRGFLRAKCPDGNLVFEPEANFADGGLARGLLAIGCTPTGKR